jgi:Na+/alanine symporter
LKNGLAKKGLRKTSKVMSIVFAVFAAFGALGIGNMFQSNQVVAQTVLFFLILPITKYGWFTNCQLL